MAEYAFSEGGLVVAAIDFGTCYSGYAFSFRDRPLEVKTNQAWVAGSASLMSLKTPTCVLLDPDREFVAFGFEAENKYSELAEDEQHSDWLLFRQFKMVLFDESLSVDTELEDIRGRREDALTIFSYAIRYMVDHLRRRLTNQVGRVLEADIQYVLTVPAIWNDKAKQFMRRAAIKAGIAGSQVSIALEPEAASIWGEGLTEQQRMELIYIGSQYIVVDLGGGTADMTAHRKMPNGSLMELHRALGGPWGGTMVDQDYLAFLDSILGRDVMARFVNEQTSDYIDLLREFETKKRTVTPEYNGRMTFRLPASLRDMCEKIRDLSLSELVQISPYFSSVSISGDKLRIDITVVRTFFSRAINGLMYAVMDMLRDVALRDTRTILLVGGFGESPMVKEAFTETLPHMNVINPQDSSLVVLKGAVKFGHMRNIICCRKSKYAYGIQAIEEFDSRFHRTEKKVVINGRPYCVDVFDKIVEIGDDLFTGKEVVQHKMVRNARQTSSKIVIYCSLQNDTRYVDEEGCYRLGDITVQLPVSNKVEDKNHTVKLLFWDTEVRVVVKIDKTGEEYETVVDCF